MKVVYDFKALNILAKENLKLFDKSLPFFETFRISCIKVHFNSKELV